MSYFLRRLMAAILQCVAASVLTFALFSVLPGDFYTAESFDPTRTAASIESQRLQAGLRDPLHQRYGAWAASCARGEFGVSLAYAMPVGQILAPRLRATLSIAIPAFVLAWLGGLGLAFAAQRYPRIGLAGMESAAASAALVPDVIGVSLLLWLVVRCGGPVSGPFLPVAGLTLALLPVVFLHASASLAAANRLLFVGIARQRGLPGRTVWLRYVLPAAANPLLSLLGLSLTAAIGGCLLVEVLTGWPGAGPLFLDAVQARDYPIVQAVILILTATLSAANFAVDLALYRLDPRIRTTA